MSNVVGTPFWSYETLSAVSGVACKTYDVDTTTTSSDGMDYRGRKINKYSDNQVATVNIGGEIIGSSPGGICLSKPGYNVASPPSGLWTNNMTEFGAGRVCLSAKFSPKAGAAAEFSTTFEINQYY